MRAFVREYRRWVWERMRARRLVPFVATDGARRVVASGSVWLREDRPHRGDLRRQSPRLHSVYVEPAARRRGIATLLVRAMLRWIRRHGYRRVVLRTSPRAEALYFVFGFRRIPIMERVWRPRRQASRRAADLPGAENVRPGGRRSDEL